MGCPKPCCCQHDNSPDNGKQDLSPCPKLTLVFGMWRLSKPGRTKKSKYLPIQYGLKIVECRQYMCLMPSMLDRTDLNNSLNLSAINLRQTCLLRTFRLRTRLRYSWQPVEVVSILGGSPCENMRKHGPRLANTSRMASPAIAQFSNTFALL